MSAVHLVPCNSPRATSLWPAEGALGLRQRADALRQPALLPARLTDSEQQQGSPPYRQFGPLSASSLVGRADEPRAAQIGGLGPVSHRRRPPTSTAERASP